MGLQILIAIGVFGLGIVIVEIFLRLFVNVPPRSGTVRPPIEFSHAQSRDFRFAPHFKGRLVSPDFNCEFLANKLGYRDPEPEKIRDDARLKVLFVGSCITLGWGVDREERISDRVSHYLSQQGYDVEVINRSFFGWRTGNYACSLAACIDEVAPDLVLFDVFTEYEFSDPGLDLKPDSSGKLSSKMRSKLRKLLRKSPLANIGLRFMHKAMGMQSAFREMELRNDRLQIYVKEDNAFQAEAARRTRAAVQEMRDLCRERNIPLIGCLMPDNVQLLSAEVFDELDYDKPQRILHKLLRDLEVPFLDLLPVFQRVNDPSTLYFSMDKHWSPKGHDVAARALAERLLDSSEVLARLNADSPEMASAG